jgi:uncharacterized protein YbjT (DUF2867 family)
MNSLRILVHGSSGTQGSAVVHRLTESGHDVRSASRRGPSSAATGHIVVAADLADVDSLIAAYRDVDVVVVQLPLEFSPTALDQASNVLTALERANVAQAVFNASGPISTVATGVPYIDARSIIADRLGNTVGRATVVAPAGPYLENLATAASAKRIIAGEVAYPTPADAAIPWLALADLAAVIDDAVRASQPPPLQIVAGPDALTGDQVADALTGALSRPVQWRTISTEEFEQQLIPQIGPASAAGIAAFYAAGPDQLPPPPDPTHVVAGTITVAAWAATIDWETAASDAQQ